MMSTGCKAAYGLQVIFAALSHILCLSLFAMTLESFPSIYAVIFVHLALHHIVARFVFDEQRSTKWWETLLSADFWLDSLANICTYHPRNADLDRKPKFYIAMELVHLVEKLALWLFISLSPDINYVVACGMMWGFYLAAILFKLIFYFWLHPWSTLNCASFMQTLHQKDILQGDDNLQASSTPWIEEDTRRNQ